MPGDRTVLSQDRAVFVLWVWRPYHPIVKKLKKRKFPEICVILNLTAPGYRSGLLKTTNKPRRDSDENSDPLSDA